MKITSWIKRAQPGISKRADLINYLIKTRDYKSYLEIGCYHNRNFNKIVAQVKVGVDPKGGGTIRKTSDEFFADNEKSFDLIFIDGLHHCQQATKDVDNSLGFLNPSGAIVLHDCNPLSEGAQQVPRAGQKTWNGDVWRAVVQLRTRLDVDIAVGDFNHGCGLLFSRPNTAPLVLPKEIAELSYRDLENNRNHWLRLMNPAQLVEFIS